MKKRRRLSVLVFVILLGVAFSVYKVLTKDHKDYTELESEGTINCKEAFNTDSFKTSIKSKIEHVYTTKGVVTHITAEGFIIDSKCVCNRHKSFTSSVKVGETIKVKGRVVSFDDLLGEIRFDSVTIE